MKIDTVTFILYLRTWLNFYPQFLYLWTDVDKIRCRRPSCSFIKFLWTSWKLM